MAEFAEGDRVVKMSGLNAGKYGTVNSVLDNGTLNVTFDGDRLAKYCDPDKCGKVAANAKIVTHDNFRTLHVGEKVDFRKSRYWKGTGVVTKVYGDDIIDVRDDKSGDEMEIHLEDILNSRTANAIPTGYERIPGGFVYHKGTIVGYGDEAYKVIDDSDPDQVLIEKISGGARKRVRDIDLDYPLRKKV